MTDAKELYNDFYNMHKEVIKELSLFIFDCTMNYNDYASKHFEIRLKYYIKKNDSENKLLDTLQQITTRLNKVGVIST